jgi:hypothetical protein
MENIKTMFEIDKKVVSLDILKEKFCCDIRICKGNCCVQGESGAPLDDDEVPLLDRIFPDLKNYLRAEGIKAIEEQGTSVIDTDGDKVTPIIGNMECAYAVFKDDIARCGIEIAYEAGAVEFRKPVSCHLYPIRINKFNDFEAVNYNRRHLCECARKYGNELNIPVYKFVEEALNRKYGKEFTDKLSMIDREVAE